NQTDGQLAVITENLDRIADLDPELASEVQSLSEAVRIYHEAAIAIATSMIDGTADMSRIADEAARNAERLRALHAELESMRELTLNRFKGAINSTVSASSQSSKISIFILLVAVAVLVGLSLIIGRSINSSLKQVINPLKDMATGKGDLTSRISYTPRDELRELVEFFNLFVEKLHGSFATIKKDVAGLNTSAEHLTGTSRTNLDRITSQSQAISFTRH